MTPEDRDDGKVLFKNTPFSVLIQEDSGLAEARRTYASKPPEERRMAADWEYHSRIANELFNNSIAMAGREGFGASYWPEGVLALAIDPLYPPALLTVGSIEYQSGRPEEAMQLFMKLTTLPEDEEDLCVVIDKAGDFLLDHEDYRNALELYSAAEKAYPHEAAYYIGTGYCLGKLGRRKEEIEKYRHADALEPDNYKHLNDLGYALLGAGELDEAEDILKRAVALAPEEYDLPRNNIDLLFKAKRKKKRKK